MTAIYDSTITTGVYLTNSATQNPATITTTGYITGEIVGAVTNSSNSYTALVGGSEAAWTVINQGTISGPGSIGNGVVFDSFGTIANSGVISSSKSGGDGILLVSGGDVTNSASGFISGYLLGVVDQGTIASTVANYGTIQSIQKTASVFSAVGVLLGPGGNVANHGTIISTASSNGFGVVLSQGGIITNSVEGLIEGAYGVSIGSGAGTIINSGTIVGTGSAAFRVGVLLRQGGSVDNAGLIEGQPALYIASVGTVTNSGTITGTATGGSGVGISAGGSVDNTGLIEGDNAVEIGFYKGGGAGTVTNSGTISGSGTHGSGISLDGGGSVANQGLIEGRNGVSINYAAGLVTNSGTILGTQTGVNLTGGGAIVNSGRIAATNNYGAGILLALIAGGETVSNLGTISDNTAGTSADVGILLLGAGGGEIINGQTGDTLGLITGYHNGIVFLPGPAASPGVVTVVNYGTIQTYGTIQSTQTVSIYTYVGILNGFAVEFDAVGTVDNFGRIAASQTAGGDGVLLTGGLVTNEAGAIIDGAGGSAVSLGGTTGAAATVSNFGALSGFVGVFIDPADTSSNTIVNYGTVTGTGGTAISLGTLGNNLVVIGSTNSSLQGVVANLQPGDRFDLPFLSFDSGGTATVVSNGTASQHLQVVENAGTFTIALDPNQIFSGEVFQLSTDSGSGTLVTEQAVCFCRGTRILTEKGEVPVEILAVGDRVKTLSGGSKPIKWIGCGRDLVTGRNSLARPIIVRAGALADEVPRRDLYLTHGHSLYLDGVLIPVEHLVNHRSIAWEDTARVVEYYHVELEDHDVLFAEGAPAESYYDAGSRALFQNTRLGSSAGLAKSTFAPVVNAGEVVERVWAELFERAGGCTEAVTGDGPDLHLVIDGERYDPVSVAQGVYTFALAEPPAGALLLRSRSGVPSLLGLSRHDHRRLGVAIRQIILQGHGVMTCLDHDAAPFREGGCHLPEDGHSWTDGELALSAELFAHLKGGFTLLVHTSKHATYYPTSAALIEAA